MESLKYDLKVFLEEPSGVRLEAFIPIFHRWIQNRCLDGVLIDVADYRHVHQGPGVILVTHEAHYGMDMSAGRMGLLYSRRREPSYDRPTTPTVTTRFRSALRATLMACQLLETEASLQGRIRFRSDELLLRINDRLLGANTVETFEKLVGHLQPFLTTLYAGSTVKMEWQSNPKSRLAMTIKTAYGPPIDTLLTRLDRDGSREGVES